MLKSNTSDMTEKLGCFWTQSKCVFFVKATEVVTFDLSDN